MKKPKAVGIHVYAGGFYLGLRDMFDCGCHLENTFYGGDTLALNGGPPQIIGGPEEWLKRDYGPVDLAYCNPPCAVWSALGKNHVGKHDWRLDPRLEDWRSAIDTSIKLKAKVIVVESVERAYRKGKEFLQPIVQRLAGLGYTVYLFLHNTKFMGLAQQRRRFMLVASKVKLEFPMTAAQWVTAGEVLANVPPTDDHERLGDALQEIAGELPIGQSANGWFEKYYANIPGITGKPRFVWHRVNPNKPAGTVAGNFMLHPTEPRALTIQEYAALCGFPPDWQWATRRLKNGSVDAGYTVSQMAKGVTPTCASHVGEVIRMGLLRGRKVTTPKVILVNRLGKSVKVADSIPDFYDEDVTKEWI